MVFVKFKKERIGEFNLNTFKNKMTIIEYEGRNIVKVKFDDGYQTVTRYSRFKSGEVENPYDKSVYDVGYLGEGTYTPLNNKKFYVVWKSMLQRCYDAKYQETRPTYRGCSVFEDWHNFQNFAHWCYENYYELEKIKMNLDKDILHKGNKIYSPETCIFVPYFINTLFIKNDASRGDLPIGVSYNTKNNKYMASGKDVYLGYYISPKEAFSAYKTYKEKLIKQYANRYKEQIPYKLYNALVNWEVEIND
jgi:hypothetical protein